MTATRLWRWPGSCARIPRDDRRLRRLRPGVRHDGAAGSRAVTATTGSSGSGCTSRPRRSSTRSAASSTCTSWPWRTRSTPISGPSSSCTARRSSSCSRRPATWTATEVVEFGEILIFLGDGFIVTVRHGEATSLTSCARRSRSDPERLKRGPGAVLHAIVDRVVDDYVPAHRGAARGHRGGRGRRVLARARQLRRAHLQAQARGARVQPRGGAAGGPARPARRGPPRADPPGGARVLPRRERPPRAGARAARGLPRAADQRPHRQPDPGQRPPERGRAQDLGGGGDHRRADHDRRHLRHELRAHARAGLAARLPAQCWPRWLAVCFALYRYFKRAGWL